MPGSYVVVPVCGVVILAGILLASVVAVILYRVFRSTTSATSTIAAVASAAAGGAAFAVWFVFASSVLFLIATILASET